MTLALVGGYVDAVGYVMLRGLFTNHVTGNLPIAAAHRGVQVLPVLLMVPLWLAAVVGVAGVAGQVHRRDPSRVLPTVLALEAVLLGGFLVIGGLAVHRLQFWAIAATLVAVARCAVSERVRPAPPGAEGPVPVLRASRAGGT